MLRDAYMGIMPNTKLKTISKQKNMGFFKRIFKRKKGGTFFGNLLRGVSNKLSGGLLGNGHDLAKWEAKQQQKKFDAAVQKQVAEQLQANNAYNAGLKGSTTSAKYLHNQPEVKQAKTKAAMNWLKKHWYFPAGFVALVVGIVFYFKGNNNKKKIK